jgi:predicted transport protein
MADIKLFRIASGDVAEVAGSAIALEKSLQTMIEQHLDTFLGVRFLASELSTGLAHGGRMDTLGIDENGCPVIIEYKRAANENVINQGLFYLDWLMDHRKDFEWLVMEKLGKEAATSVEWSAPRLICIAGDFTRYDEHAVKQMNRSIELIRYRRYGDELLLFDLVHQVSIQSPAAADLGAATTKLSGKRYKTVSEYLAEAEPRLVDLFEALKASLLALGDDVQMKVLRYYFAFKRIKNFACIEIRPQKGAVLVYIKVDPDTIQLHNGFTRDVRHVGHFGTGDLEITIGGPDDIERAMPLIQKSYEAS